MGRNKSACVLSCSSWKIALSSNLLNNDCELFPFFPLPPASERHIRLQDRSYVESGRCHRWQLPLLSRWPWSESQLQECPQGFLPVCRSHKTHDQKVSWTSLAETIFTLEISQFYFYLLIFVIVLHLEGSFFWDQFPRAAKQRILLGTT